MLTFTAPVAYRPSNSSLSTADAAAGRARVPGCVSLPHGSAAPGGAQWSVTGLKLRAVELDGRGVVRATCASPPPYSY